MRTKVLLSFVTKCILLTDLFCANHSFSQSADSSLPAFLLQSDDQPTVLLVSIDGFRADYLDRYQLNSFRRLMREGVRADGLIPVFPSVTYPNHYSIVTGLYPDHHGMIDNNFYDPQRKEYFYPDRYAGDGSWYRGEPIWMTAEQQGIRSACLYWVGCTADIGGIRPSLRMGQHQELTVEQRIDQVLAWLQLPHERRPHLITLYLSDQLDAAGHWYGPNAIEIQTVLQTIDRQVGYLLDRLRGLPSYNRLYVLFVSDHGMSQLLPEHFTGLLPQFDPKQVVAKRYGLTVRFHIVDSTVSPVALRDRINQSLSHGRAYLRSEIPTHLHYREDPRIGDVVVVMDFPYLLGTDDSEEPGGMHGWDPTQSEMHGIFLALGPHIKPGQRLPPFENVHIYPFIAEILKLTMPVNIDGKRDWLRQVITQ